MENSDQPSSYVQCSSSEEPPPVGCKDDKAVNTGCGWGRFQPAILGPFAHVWTFIVLYIVFSFTHAFLGSYPTGILTTLERRFNLSSSLSGFIVNTSLIGNVVSIIIVSVFFAKRNTPRLFAVSMLLTSIAAFLYFLPHIVSGGTGNEAINKGHTNATALVNRGSGAVQLCADGDSRAGGPPPEGAERTMCSAEERQTADEGVSYVLSAVLLISIADFIHGIAGAPSWTVGLAFLDDNTHPELSARLVGLMFSVRVISPVVSFAVGGYFLSIHTSLKETDMTQKHPQWIGAWWLGFLVITILNFILFIPMSMLPKNIRPIRRYSSTTASLDKGKEIGTEEEQKEDLKSEVLGEAKKLEGKDAVAGKEHREEQNVKEVKLKKENGENNQQKPSTDEEDKDNHIHNLEEEEVMKKEGTNEENMAASTTGERTSSGPIESIDSSSSIDYKEFQKAMKRLITNPIYVLTVFSICFDWASLVFMGFMPKYFEVQFQKTASVASLLGGMVPATCAACAAIVGGLLAGTMKGIDGGVAGLCRLNLFVSLTSILLLVPASLLACPNISYSGHLINNRLNVTTKCNDNCGCWSDVFDPVCGGDGLLYFSPCHAGCTQLVNSTIHPNVLRVRSNECRCVAAAEEGIDEDERDNVVFDGFCEAACSSFIPYLLTVMAIAVVRSLDSASTTTVILRCIEKKDKSYALGLHTLCLCLSILPAPMLYGKVFDSSCILKRTSSCTDSKGSCLLYDRQSLRLNYHGLAMALKSIATILFCVTYFIARRKLALLTTQQQMRQTELKTVINTK